VKLEGRILFLTEDPELIKRQLAGEDLPWDTKNPANNPKLRDDISTDEITPAHLCFYFDQTLGEIPYAGLKCGNETPIGRGDVKRGAPPRHPAIHRTRSLDYVIVLEGEIDLLLDEGEVRLAAGDVVVQRGTLDDLSRAPADAFVARFVRAQRALGLTSEAPP